MASIRPFTSQNLQNYPQIKIDRGTVIKPCNADQNAADQFINRHKSNWKRIVFDIWQEGIPFILRWFSNLQTPVNPSIYYLYIIRALKYIAFLLLHIHRIYLYIYGYFFPYSLLPLDDVCDEFSRCTKWSEAVIKAFAWHPTQDRCALAICNDYVYVYQGATRIRVLRHAQQRKITDMVWQPASKEILVVATQTQIILWRISETFTNHLNFSRNPTYLTPGLQLVMRTKETPPHANGSTIKQNNIAGISQQCDTSTANQQTSSRDFKILSKILPAPIISLQFSQDGNKLYACSPNSSKIATLDIDRLFNQCIPESTNKPNQKLIEYLTRYGAGVTRLLWSPMQNRLATATTSSFIRVFEPIKWTHNRWALGGDMVQDMAWSKPHGRILLLANKTEPFLYALPFLDNPQAGDVGGNKSLMKALDLTATQSESGEMVGGTIQSLAWDKSGKRLAVSFRENPESILLYRTMERPTVEFHQLGLIRSDTGSTPLLMDFHDNFKSGSLLTVCWSDGTCQHIPMFYMPNEQMNLNASLANDSFNRSMNGTFHNNSHQDPSSPARTPRSLTNFCHVSGNNSISSYPSSLMPINRIQHQTTLFSLSGRSPVEALEDISDLIED